MGLRMGEPGLEGPLQGPKRNQSPGVVQALLWWALVGSGSQSHAHRPPSFQEQG